MAADKSMVRLKQAAVLAAGIGILYAIQLWAKAIQKKEGFQQEVPIQCIPGTELRLENGMCCPFGIVDVANCWLTPKCPEPAFWDASRMACMTKDPNRDPYVLGFPTCQSLSKKGRPYVFDLDQRKCCDPDISSGPKQCDANFNCYKSRWDSKRGYCIGKDPRFTALGDAIAASIPAETVVVPTYEKSDTILVWAFGGLAIVVLIATALRR